MNEKEVLRRMADDVRAIRNVLETVFRRQEFAMILRGLRDRGIITQDDVERLENSNAEAQRRGDAETRKGAAE